MCFPNLIHSFHIPCNTACEVQNPRGIISLIWEDFPSQVTKAFLWCSVSWQRSHHQCLSLVGHRAQLHETMCCEDIGTASLLKISNFFKLKYFPLALPVNGFQLWRHAVFKSYSYPIIFMIYMKVTFRHSRYLHYRFREVFFLGIVYYFLIKEQEKIKG